MNFKIAGAFAKFKEISLMIVKNRRIAKNLIVYDGINNCAWNGGRINRDLHWKQSQIDFYYKRNIGIALTFSNPNIDLTDEVGNALLEKFHKDGNEIILINEDLRRYIRKNYPKYKLVFSITGLGTINVPMQNTDVNKYLVLQAKYDLIVPRMEHVFDARFNELNPSQYEVMLNDTCAYNCPLYQEHFEAIALQNTLAEKPWEQLGHDACFKVEECWLPNFDFTVGDEKTIKEYGEDYGMDLTTKQVKRLLDLGVMCFKISGRELESEEFNDEIMSYLNYRLEEGL